AEDGGVIGQRLTCPVLADLAEESVLNRIPLGGSVGVVAHGHRQLKAVGQFFLESAFPQPTPGAVAAAAIGQDQQFGHLTVASPAFATPPLRNRIDRKLRRVVRGAQQHRATIGPQIIQAAGNGHALGLRAKIVVVDWKSLRAPEAAGILESSHQFLLFAVHADNRQALAAELSALALEVTELTVALRAARTGETLAIDVQRIAQLLQQTPHRVGTDREAQFLQFFADLLQAQARPKAPPSHRIPGGVVAEQAPQLAQKAGRFFSTRGRPPPT